MTRHPARQTTAKHLLRWTRQELGATRYLAFCGYSSTTGRDFAANLTDKGRQVVTCVACVDATPIQYCKCIVSESNGSGRCARCGKLLRPLRKPPRQEIDLKGHKE